MARKRHGDGLSSAKRRAFTLIEILSVVIILGMMAAIIVPQLGPRSDLDVSAGARIVMSDLLYAQNRAISTQGWTYVTFSTTNQNYTLYGGTSTGPTTTTPLQHPVNLNNYVMSFNTTGSNTIANTTLSSLSFGGTAQTLVFDESGTPYYYTSGSPTLLSGAATITLASGNNTLTISVQQDTGDISVQ